MAAAKKSTTSPITGKTQRGRLRVRATDVGYYDHVRRRIGDVFTLQGVILEDGGLDSFSPRWMEAVHPETEGQITTGAQDLARKHDEILNATLGRSPQATADNPLGSD